MASIYELILEKGEENFVHEEEMSKTFFLFLPLAIQNRRKRVENTIFHYRFYF